MYEYNSKENTKNKLNEWNVNKKGDSKVRKLQRKIKVKQKNDVSYINKTNAGVSETDM